MLHGNFGPEGKERNAFTADEVKAFEQTCAIDLTIPKIPVTLKNEEQVIEPELYNADSILQSGKDGKLISPTTRLTIQELIFDPETYERRSEYFAWKAAAESPMEQKSLEDEQVSISTKTFMALQLRAHQLGCFISGGAFDEVREAARMQVQQERALEQEAPQVAQDQRLEGEQAVNQQEREEAERFSNEFSYGSLGVSTFFNLIGGILTFWNGDPFYPSLSPLGAFEVQNVIGAGPSILFAAGGILCNNDHNYLEHWTRARSIQFLRYTTQASFLSFAVEATAYFGGGISASSSAALGVTTPLAAGIGYALYERRREIGNYCRNRLFNRGGNNQGNYLQPPDLEGQQPAPRP